MHQLFHLCMQWMIIIMKHYLFAVDGGIVPYQRVMCIILEISNGQIWKIWIEYKYIEYVIIGIGKEIKQWFYIGILMIWIEYIKHELFTL